MWKKIKLNDGGVWRAGDVLCGSEDQASWRMKEFPTKESASRSAVSQPGVIHGYDSYWVLRWVEEEKNEFGVVTP
jgi:hypothetical protein